MGFKDSSCYKVNLLIICHLNNRRFVDIQQNVFGFVIPEYDGFAFLSAIFTTFEKF